MINLEQLTEQDYEKMAQEITEISEAKSEEELFEIIGHALHDNGLTVSTAESFEIVQPKMFNEDTEKFNMIETVSYVLNTKALVKNRARGEGRKFWKRFKDKLRSVICNDSKIRALLEGNGTLKDYLITVVPLILAALGFALNPLSLAVIAAVMALIVKSGFQAYCEAA